MADLQHFDRDCRLFAVGRMQQVNGHAGDRVRALDGLTGEKFGFGSTFCYMKQSDVYRR